MSRFRDSIISQIKKNGIIELVSDLEMLENPQSAIIETIFHSPSKIFLDDEGLFYFEDDDKIYCPEICVTISEKGEWLSDMIPTIEFDSDQAGNVRKAEEAEALFCLIVVSQVMQNEIFITSWMKSLNTPKLKIFRWLPFYLNSNPTCFNQPFF